MAAPSARARAPPHLPGEIVEDILVCFPPDHPAYLVRAALVCKDWSRRIASHGFRHRYRQRHREVPVLGFVANLTDGAARFTPTGSAFCPARADRHGYLAHDARHGRVLLRRMHAPKGREEDPAIAVWDPISGEQRPLPPLRRHRQVRSNNAAVLCAAPDCDHLVLDCRSGHFLVAFVGIDDKEMFAHVYSSESAVWSEATATTLPGGGEQLAFDLPGVLARGALYFVFAMRDRILKCDPATREMSVVQLPYNLDNGRMMLMTMEDGGLGFAQVDMDCTLRLWSMKTIGTQQGADGGLWVISRAIDLKTQLTTLAQLPARDRHLSVVALPCVVVAFAEGADVIFLRTDDGLYTFDLKSDQAVKVYKSSGFCDIIPYVSFYTPVLRVGITGEGPSAGPSTA